jgi:hypothetical protein
MQKYDLYLEWINTEFETDLTRLKFLDESHFQAKGMSVGSDYMPQRFD